MFMIRFMGHVPGDSGGPDGGPPSGAANAHFGRDRTIGVSRGGLWEW